MTLVGVHDGGMIAGVEGGVNEDCNVAVGVGRSVDDGAGEGLTPGPWPMVAEQATQSTAIPINVVNREGEGFMASVL